MEIKKMKLGEIYPLLPERKGKQIIEEYIHTHLPADDDSVNVHYYDDGRIHFIATMGAIIGAFG